MPATDVALLTDRAVGRVLSLHVVDEPVPMGRPRVRSRGVEKPHGYTPARTKQAVWRIKDKAAEAMQGMAPFEGPLELVVYVWVAMPRSITGSRRATARPYKRPDLDRYINTAMDGLAPVWNDDAQVVKMHAEKRYAGVAPYFEVPGWHLTVTELL